MTTERKEKWTEGPWHVTTGKHTETTDTHDEGETWFNINGEEGAIADVLHGRCLDATEEDAEANARLIAAAPELYEALKELLIWYKDATSENVSRNYDVVEQAESALSFATGEPK